MIDVDAFLAGLAGAGSSTEARFLALRFGAAALAYVWSPPPSPYRLALALTAAGAELDEDRRFEVWARVDAVVAEHTSAMTIIEAILPEVCGTHVDKGDLGPGLHVPEELAGRLPLLDLAEDVARRHTRLVVEATAPEGLWGCWSTAHRSGAVILLDASLDDGTLAHTWAHELGHALDPAHGHVVQAGAEAFADEMAELLLEAEPATVAAAGPLVARALAATCGLRVPTSDGSLEAFPT